MNRQEEQPMFIGMELQGFCERFLSAESSPYLLALWEAVKECRELNVTRGKPDAWAAAISYAFARMNFLLDDEGKLHIEREAFFEFFSGCSRSTVTQKATRIEKALNFYHGHPQFGLPEVVQAMPRLRQLPNGMITLEDPAVGETDDGRKIELVRCDGKESQELERQIREHQQQEEEQAREEEKKRAKDEALRRKREEELKTQPELFDFGD